MATKEKNKLGGLLGSAGFKIAAGTLTTFASKFLPKK